MKKDHRFTIYFFIWSAIWAFVGLYNALIGDLDMMIVSLVFLVLNGFMCAKTGYDVTIWNMEH